MGGHDQAVADAFWAAWREGTLLLQRCVRCESIQYYPRILCVACGAFGPEWIAAEGAGTVYSYTVVRRAPTPSFAEREPYAIALIDLDEGPRVMANIVDSEPGSLACGVRVEVVRERPPSNWDGLIFRLS